MRALLLHCKNYHIRIGALATRPIGIQPEAVSEREQESHDCIVVLLTIERGDTTSKADALEFEIVKMADSTGVQGVTILPFAHLSNNLADSETGKAIVVELVRRVSQKLLTTRGHFGSHKELLLDIFGHPGNVRYREF